MTLDLSPSVYGVRRVTNVRIPTRDGTLLAADLYLPDADGAFPAVIEYLPYRKDDLSAHRWNMHHALARRGYVGVRLDVRGTGSSAGVAEDEYTLTEQLDGYDAVEWIARQPWCDGNVGMWGTSYGGFNCIQVAMHRPPHLKAIAPHAATDDRYGLDVHYSGGCLMAMEQVVYPAWMVAMNALPPDPGIGADWAKVWEEHLASPPWVLAWLRHQTEDAYWANGSLKTDYSAITCPVFMIGGWLDGYVDAVFRMATHLTVPYRALVGPWSHMRPDGGYAGPHIDFERELTRWWDHWLKGRDTGLMEEPPIVYYARQWHPPERFPPHVPGEWRAAPHWPPPEQRTETLILGDGGRLLASSDSGEREVSFRHVATVGTDAGAWCPSSPPNGIDRDQRTDDARSVCFDGPPLTDPLEILGVARARLFVSAEMPVAFFHVKLCDVAADGSSLLVARGILNATRRDGFARPEALTPGAVYALDIPLKVTSWRFDPGHRLRVVIAASDFPSVWPAPHRGRQSVWIGGNRPSAIALPVVAPPERALAFAAPVAPAPLPKTADVWGESASWQTIRDELGEATTVRIAERHTVRPHGVDVEVAAAFEATATASDRDPAAVSVVGVQRYEHRAMGMTTEAVGRTAISSTADAFHADVELTVRRDGVVMAQKRWIESFPRELL